MVQLEYTVNDSANAHSYKGAIDDVRGEYRYTGILYP